MSKVFVVQENPRMDYSPAEAHGEVVFMTAEEFKPMANSLRNKVILEDVQRHMDKFDPENDLLILTGNPMVMGYAFHQAMKKSNSINCLQWDRIHGEYRQVVFTA